MSHFSTYRKVSPGTTPRLWKSLIGRYTQKIFLVCFQMAAFASFFVAISSFHPGMPSGIPRVWADSTGFFRQMGKSCLEHFLQHSAPSPPWNIFPWACSSSLIRVSLRDPRFQCWGEKKEPRKPPLLLWNRTLGQHTSSERHWGYKLANLNTNRSGPNQPFACPHRLLPQVLTDLKVGTRWVLNFLDCLTTYKSPFIKCMRRKLNLQNSLYSWCSYNPTV